MKEKKEESNEITAGGWIWSCKGLLQRTECKMAAAIYNWYKWEERLLSGLCVVINGNLKQRELTISFFLYFSLLPPARVGWERDSLSLFFFARSPSYARLRGSYDELRGQLIPLIYTAEGWREEKKILETFAKDEQEGAKIALRGFSFHFACRGSTYFPPPIRPFFFSDEKLEEFSRKLFAVVKWKDEMNFTLEMAFTVFFFFQVLKVLWDPGSSTLEE